MFQNWDEEKMVRSYLFGELSENEQDDLEKKLLDDPEFLQVADIVEDELLYGYVIELLSECERTKLESGLLRTARAQHRVKLIRLLHQELNPAMAVKKRSPYPLLMRHFRWQRRLSAQLALAAVVS